VQVGEAVPTEDNDEGNRGDGDPDQDCFEWVQMCAFVIRGALIRAFRSVLVRPLEAASSAASCFAKIPPM
jgi:hypothetical protein